MRSKTSERAADRRPRLSRGRRRASAVALVIVVAFAVLTARLLVWPAQGMPGRVSAIAMLAGPGNRLPMALQLARQHRAPVLVVSRGFEGYSGPCPRPSSGVQLICFDPDPGDTRGEIEVISRLAKRHHWSSVVLIATRPQDTRARMMMERCFSGPTYVVTAPLPVSTWPYQIAYGWGALLKALVVDRAC
jgi:hypothetical protein